MDNKEILFITNDGKEFKVNSNIKKMLNVQLPEGTLLHLNI